MARSWLLTAFDPFLDRTVNHSMAVLDKILAMNRDPELRIHSLILPTEYDRCALVLQAEIRRLQEAGVRLEGVLSIGEGREEFKIETQANNLDHSPSFTDNAGIVRVQTKIFPEREEVLPFSFTFDRFEIPASMNPGFFVCNHLCARMAIARDQDPGLPPFGFIHVPRSDLADRYSTEHCAQVILEGLTRPS
jgi:pyrrolidone-carboxylate peptidase